MKAILEFNLPEDTGDYHLHTQAANMYSALYELKHFLRQKTKYADDDVSDDYLKAYEECKEYFSQMLVDYDISLEI